MRAAVITKEIDLSTRVPSFPGAVGALVIKARKGPLDENVLITTDSQLLDMFTENGRVEVGDDTAFFSALNYLQKSDKMWIRRAAKDALFGGYVFKSDTSTTANFGLPVGLVDPTAFIFDALPDIDGLAEITEIDTVADSGGSLDARFFIIFDAAGSVGVWIDVDDSGTSIPAGAAAADRAIEVTGVTTGMSDVDVAIQIASTLNGDPAFTAPVPSVATAVITDAADGSRVDAADGGAATGFSFNVTQQGVDEVDATDETLLIYQWNPGVWGNNIFLKLTTSDDDPLKAPEPNSFLIEVFKTDNLVVPVESHICSRVPGTKDGFGNNIYVVDALAKSSFVRAIDNTAVVETVLPQSQLTPAPMTGGDDGTAVTDSEMILAAESAFSNKDEVFITILMDGGNATPAYQLALDDIVTKRIDSVAIFSVPIAAEASPTFITEILAYKNTTLNLNSSRSAIYTPHVKIFDKFNDRDIFVSPDGFVGAAISFSAANFEIWFPPAGFRRGSITALDLRRRFTNGEMDILYDNSINPLRFAPGRGIFIWGQKTLSARPSALDRLNVRLLLIVIEPAVSEALEDFLFELNDEATRSIASALVSGFMDNIQARRGVTAFRVVADESNNSAEDIDAGRMNLHLFVKPTRSLEEIPFSVVITATGVSFELASSLV